MNVVFVTQFTPKSVGHGGNHRAYQIVCDLIRAVGRDHVHVVSYEEWKDLQNRKGHALQSVPVGTPGWSVHMARRLRKRMERLPLIAKIFYMVEHRFPYLRIHHPVDLLMNASLVLRTFAMPGFIRCYEECLKQLEKPVTCVVEHVSLASHLLPLNEREQIPTMACPQNIESLDCVLPFVQNEARPKYLAALGLADEWRVFERCAHTLCISKVETGLLGGLGVTCDYYPYRPVDEIRAQLLSIREYRRTHPSSDCVFLLVGSCYHGTTYHSFMRFFHSLTNADIPDGYQLVVMGSRTDALPIPSELKARVELRGIVSTEELESWLRRARGVLVPQSIGFGALTRLAEFSCAGIPVAVSRHPTFSINVPPSTWVVNRDPQDWREIMQTFASGISIPALDEYVAWEQSLPVPWSQMFSSSP